MTSKPAQDNSQPLDAGHSRWITLGLMAAVVVGAALRFIRITKRPIAGDEPFTWIYSLQPLSNLFGPQAKLETNPPIYYALQHFWGALGDGPLALRSLAALIGIATIPLVFGFGRRVGNAWIGLIAAWLFATSPLHVRFAQTARGYTMLTFGAVMALWGLAGVLQRRGDTLSAPRLNQGKSCFGAWSAFVAGTTIALYSHNTAVLFWALAAGATLVAWFCSVPRAPRFLWHWLAANVAILLLWGWWGQVMWWQVRHATNVDWIPKPTLSYSAGVLWDVFAPGRIVAPPMTALVFAAALALAVFGAVRWRKNPAALALTLGLLVAMPLLTVVLSLKKSILIDRVLLWPTVPMYVLIAAGMAALPRRWSGATAGAALLLQMGAMRFYYMNIWDFKYGDVTNIILTEKKPGDAIVYLPIFQWLPIRYFGRDRIAEMPSYGWQPSVTPDDTTDTTATVHPISPGGIARILQKYDRVWFMVDSSSDDSELRAAEADPTTRCWTIDRTRLFLVQRLQQPESPDAH